MDFGTPIGAANMTLVQPPLGMHTLQLPRAATAAREVRPAAYIALQVVAATQLQRSCNGPEHLAVAQCCGTGIGSGQCWPRKHCTVIRITWLAVKGRPGGAGAVTQIGAPG
jgi:hypothetical protein